MKYRVIAADPLYERLLTIELERLGFVRSNEDSEDYGLLAAEGQSELPPTRRYSAAILIECGLLSAYLPETVKVLILGRPFSLAELRAFASELERNSDTPTDGDGIRLYPDELAVGYGDSSSKLTKREYELFVYLHSRPGEIVTRDELLREIWQDETARDTNVVDVYIKFLRTKLDERFGVKLIRAKRGEGYSYFPEMRKSEN